VDLEHSVGYVLKRAVTALRAAMDADLRVHGLSVPQFACLKLLGSRPGLSNADLARGAFVTRQATHSSWAACAAPASCGERARAAASGSP